MNQSNSDSKLVALAVNDTLAGWVAVALYEDGTSTVRPCVSDAQAHEALATLLRSSLKRGERDAILLDAESPLTVSIDPRTDGSCELWVQAGTEIGSRTGLSTLTAYSLLGDAISDVELRGTARLSLATR